MRQAPDLVSEMISQLLFAETFEVLETESRYARIRSAHDGYEGWIDLRQAVELTERDYAWLRDDSHHAVATSTTGEASNGTRTQPVLRGTRLPGFGNGKFALPDEMWWFRGEARRRCGLALDAFLSSVHEYEHTPYLWGGRSPFGIDCSGLVQMAYGAFGVRLPRDSSQQRECGKAVDDLQATEPGDLAFFGSSMDGSSHVGIVMPNQRIMHASSSVRHDRLEAEGIRHDETDELTHITTCYRRVVDFDLGKSLDETNFDG